MSSVLLPAPLGPMTAWMSPWRTCRLTSLRATMPPKRMVTRATSRMGWVICSPPRARWKARPARGAGAR
ncbi:Uncharacterised protein [Bordetella pertussis]|nr:Uncharacterised protein [Bordetella pertussis]